MKIKGINARQILDSRGNPTIEAEVVISNAILRASVPSGASTGTFEAVELRDGNKKFYNGKSVLNAIHNVKNIISKCLIGMDCEEQNDIDYKMIELDGTENKSRLGANAILAVSMAVARAGAYSSGMELYEYLAQIYGNKKISIPVPMLNLINSGKHAGIKNDIQEHMIVPIKFERFSESIRAGSEIFHILKNLIKKDYGIENTHIGDEGGYVVHLKNVAKRLKMLLIAIENAGYSNKVFIALDCAATEFFNGKQYILGNRKMNASQLLDFYKELTEHYNIISIEDGFAEEDWDAWIRFTKNMGKYIMIVGDDLLVTNPKRIKKAVKLKACNTLLLKLNQIGTVSEAMESAKIARDAEWKIVVSHRSGETCDSFIADFACSISAEFIKSGAPCRSERLSKYNRLLRIEEKIY